MSANLLKATNPRLNLEQGSPTQRKGAAAESLALDYLQMKGLRLLERNVHWRGGEIDLIMQEAQQIVFVEVRVRQRSDYGGALASISLAKQKRLANTAQIWLLRRFGQAAWPMCRFDVMAQSTDDWTWVRSAFEFSSW